MADAVLEPLVHLLQGYYHQDVWEEYESDEDVWREFLGHGGSDGISQAVDVVLSWDIDRAVDFIVQSRDEMGGFGPDDAESIMQWLNELRSFLHGKLGVSPKNSTGNENDGPEAEPDRETPE